MRTGRTGAAAKGRAQSLIHVTAWQAPLEGRCGSPRTSIVSTRTPRLFACVRAPGDTGARRRRPRRTSRRRSATGRSGRRASSSARPRCRSPPTAAGSGEQAGSEGLPDRVRPHGRRRQHARRQRRRQADRLGYRPAQTCFRSPQGRRRGRVVLDARLPSSWSSL